MRQSIINDNNGYMDAAVPHCKGIDILISLFSQLLTQENLITVYTVVAISHSVQAAHTTHILVLVLFPVLEAEFVCDVLNSLLSVASNMLTVEHVYIST